MSKIDAFNSKRIEVQNLKAITELQISQIDFGSQQGRQPQFIVSGMNANALGVVVDYLKKNFLTEILPKIIKAEKAELDALKLEAIAEGEQFKVDNTASVI